MTGRSHIDHLRTSMRGTMAEIGIQTLERDAAAVVAMAARGEFVTIIEDGRPVARMVPYASGRLEAMIAAGLARPALRELSELPPPAPRQPDEAVLSEELARMRSSERF